MVDLPAGKPLLQKLGLKPGQRLVLRGAPAGFAETLEPLPAGAAVEAHAALQGGRARRPAPSVAMPRRSGPGGPSARAVGPATAGTDDLVLLFAPDHAALVSGFAASAALLTAAGALWVAWPKKASGVATDLTGDRVRTHGLECGLVDVKVCAVDDTWSGLKFVRRLRDR